MYQEGVIGKKKKNLGWIIKENAYVIANKNSPQTSSSYNSNVDAQFTTFFEIKNVFWLIFSSINITKSNILPSLRLKYNSAENLKKKRSNYLLHQKFLFDTFIRTFYQLEKNPSTQSFILKFHL